MITVNLTLGENTIDVRMEVTTEAIVMYVRMEVL